MAKPPPKYTPPKTLPPRKVRGMDGVWRIIVYSVEGSVVRKVVVPPKEK